MQLQVEMTEEHAQKRYGTTNADEVLAKMQAEARELGVEIQRDDRNGMVKFVYVLVTRVYG